MREDVLAVGLALALSLGTQSVESRDAHAEVILTKAPPPADMQAKKEENRQLYNVTLSSSGPPGSGKTSSTIVKNVPLGAAELVRKFSDTPGKEYAKYAALFEDCAETVELPTAEKLSEFSARAGGNITLVSADIFSGYAPLTNKFGRWWVPKAIGVEVSSSLPAQAAELTDYADHQLLLRDGGLFNGYFSFASSPVWYGTNDECRDAQTASLIARGVYEEIVRTTRYQRPFMPTRLYLSSHPVVPFMRPYFTHGIGVKAIRTGLEDNEETGEDGDGLAAAGVAYIGFGVSGPVYDKSSYSVKSSAGTIDLQVNAAATRLNPNTLSELYQGDDIDDKWVYSAGVRFSMLVTGAFSMLVDYATPLGPAEDYISDVTVFSIAYNIDAAQKEQAARTLLIETE